MKEMFIEKGWGDPKFLQDIGNLIIFIFAVMK